jgi:hypothetical protein
MRSVVGFKSRVVTVVATTSLAFATLVVGPPSAQAEPTPCLSKNLTTGDAASSDLQAVIDAASPGATIQVEGVCVGGFVINKDLELLGQPTPGSPQPTLDGNAASRVIRIRGGMEADVTITDLTITNGLSHRGGGIHIRYANLTLDGSASVVGNLARRRGSRGGGVYVHRGTVTLNDSSSIEGNTSRSLYYGRGGGVYNTGGTVTLNDSSSVTGNVSGGHAGGIFSIPGDATSYPSAVDLNDSSTVADNTASSYGGGIANAGGTVTLSGSSSVANNTAQMDVGASYGGGISNGGRVTLRDSSSVTGNSASSGGAVYTYYGWLEACNSNGAHEWAGAISPNNPDDTPTPIPVTCT